MSKSKRKKSRAPMTEEERLRSEEASRILRENREAATGPRAIDRDIHSSLPLTRVAYISLGLSVAAYFVSRLGIYLNSAPLVNVCGIAIMVLFPLAFICWFISRHQAKKLTSRAQPKAAGSDGAQGADRADR